jgi:hypothetical protein
MEIESLSVELPSLAELNRGSVKRFALRYTPEQFEAMLRYKNQVSVAVYEFHERKTKIFRAMRAHVTHHIRALHTECFLHQPELLDHLANEALTLAGLCSEVCDYWGNVLRIHMTTSVRCMELLRYYEADWLPRSTEPLSIETMREARSVREDVERLTRNLDSVYRSWNPAKRACEKCQHLVDERLSA